jgi:hypothetical protein
MFEYKTNFYYPQLDYDASVDDKPNFDPNTTADEETANDIPAPRTRKEYYLAKIAGLTPTKKKAVFSGYGEYSFDSYLIDGRYTMIPTVHVSAQYLSPNATVMIGDQKCSYVESLSDFQSTICSFIINNSSIIIHIDSEADAANKVVIFKTVEAVLPQPKTATEFYLAKMAGVEVVDHLEKVFEQEFTFGTEPDGKGNYDVTISNAYDEAVDTSHLIAHIDGNDNHPFNTDCPDDGSVLIRTTDASYAGTTHTLELFYKTVIEDVPARTRHEQYLKMIANKKALNS